MIGVISVGANRGQEYEYWLSEGAGNFIFFEPIKSTYEKLVDIMSTREGNIKTFNLALGNKTGLVEMYVETEHQGKSCSILEPKLHLVQYPDIEFTHKELVRVDKLDNIDYDRYLYDHLHVDAQGYELEVLKGAKKSLSGINTIECEVYREELYEGCPMIGDIISFLLNKGFEMYDLKWFGNTWGNGFFKRRK